MNLGGRRTMETTELTRRTGRTILNGISALFSIGVMALILISVLTDHPSVTNAAGIAAFTVSCLYAFILGRQMNASPSYKITVFAELVILFTVGVAVVTVW
jgi:membrane associated rhomboid family serine protease